MFRFVKHSKLFMTTLAVGIIAFACYGSFNVIHAFNRLQQDENEGDNMMSLNASDSFGVAADGSTCSPYGCAGCGLCTNPEYQQVISAYESAVDIE